MDVLKKILICLLFICAEVYSQQINIPKIEQMPNAPTPYVMRNWKAVARGYDSLVYNFNLSGQYLPLGGVYTNTVNYINHQSFWLDTYVGGRQSHKGEAINILPSVVGATLIGIDKSNQAGNNWALYCEEFFNKKNQEMVYLNGPSSESGSDWWYSTMPNVFFYQLYDLYGNIGDYKNQFVSVADRWLEAVRKMGGSAAPWDIPNMDYRGWYLASMTPNTQGVHQPEAAGAIAWLLYNAYSETGNKKYRAGAEWALEFLNLNYSNPSYELQLPYGVYTAARMNAEIGTGYDIEKFLNWCFETGPLRSWGSVTGSWGGYDMSGLIGEVSSNDYAFLMNGFQHAAALAPMIRYDEKFARAIGKWILNLANASRLFYPNCLPDYNQDSREWPRVYDPNSYIAHEAIKQFGPGNISPYATGDAVKGGWAETNLSLYSSSHVGYLAAIVDTTNVEKVLKLDLLKTDFYHDKAYPTFLFYNPYPTEKTIEIDAGNGTRDIYNTITKTFLKSGVSGITTITIPADGAVVAVVVPAGGTITYNKNKKLLNNIIIDYNGNPQQNISALRIKMLAAVKEKIVTGDSTGIYCTAADKISGVLNYTWNPGSGSLSGTGDKIMWKAPLLKGLYPIVCKVTNSNGDMEADTLSVEVIDAPNSVPSINSIKAFPGKVNIGSSCEVTCIATDSGNSQLVYKWSAASGTISGSGAKIKWQAPGVKGNYFIVCSVQNALGEIKTDSVAIPVRDLSKINYGKQVLFLPFNGNANDESGLGNNGSAYGTILTNDREGKENSAYYFNGSDAFVQVSNSLSLNITDTIVINFWMNISELFQREAYPISHGNWENRWKISITDNRIRWTIKTENGIKDLDSKTVLGKNKFYNITAYYDGSDMEIYVNGELDSFAAFSGKINLTNYELTIGQVLPGNKNYNFKGILDDIRIYNYALSVSDIWRLFTGITSVKNRTVETAADYNILMQNYPNPFNPATRIKYSLPKASKVTLKIYDVIGREVAQLENSYKEQGNYEILFNAVNLSSGVYWCVLRAENKRIVKKILLLQ